MKPLNKKNSTLLLANPHEELSFNSIISNPKVQLFAVFSIIVLIICLSKYLLVSNGSFFVLGDDSRRHLAVIESFMENKGIVYPKTAEGYYGAYVYYAPLFHFSIAVLSLITSIPPQLIQNIIPLICLLLFFVFSFKLIKYLLKEKYSSLFAATIILAFLPLEPPNPHTVIYFILLPMIFCLMFRIFAKTEESKSTIINYVLVFLVALAIGLTHSQSMAMYFVCLTLALIFGTILYSNAKTIQTLSKIWIVNSFAYISAFYLYSFITPTFWEAIMHYFNLTLMDAAIREGARTLYYNFHLNGIIFTGGLLILSSVAFCIAYFGAPTIIKLRKQLIERKNSIIQKIKPEFDAKKLWLIPSGLAFLVLSYFALINIIFTIFQYAAIFIFRPEIPYFARISAIQSLSWILMFGKSGFDDLLLPYSAGLLLLLFLSTYALSKFFKEDIISKIPAAAILLAFLAPTYFMVLTLPFVTVSNFVSPLILDRLLDYTYMSLAFFASLPILIAFEYALTKWKNPVLKYSPYLIFLAVFACTTLGIIFTTAYAINPIQNNGYEWLIKNTPVKETSSQFDFDLLGYYHITSFPTQYRATLFEQNFITIDLLKNMESYHPIVTVNFFGIKYEQEVEVYFKENPVLMSDDKIYENDLISFYYTQN